MKRIMKLELLRARKIYNKKLLITVSISLVIILSLFFFILRIGGLYQNVFYTFASDDNSISTLLNNNPLFKQDTNQPDLHILSGQKIRLVPNGLKGFAAAQSAYRYFKDYSYFVYESFEENPVLLIRLVTVNQSTEYMEENRNQSNVEYRNEEIPNLEINSDINEIYSEDAFDNKTETTPTSETTSTTAITLSDNQEETKQIQTKINKTSDEVAVSEKEVMDINEIQEKREEIYNDFKNQRGRINKLESEEINKEIDNEDKDLLTAKDLEPRMPFDQIYLAMAFIVLLTFVSLIFSNRIMDEKINKKGILLLVAPVKKIKIIIGKTLPYYLIALGLSIAISLVYIRSILSFITFIVVINGIIFMYLAISFFIAVFARSFKEISFLGIFSISIYSLSLLIPVFLINFSEASYASPLTIIVETLLNQKIGIDVIIFSTIPHLTLGFGMFLVGYILYNAEDLFNYKNLKDKILDFFRIYVKSGKDFFVSGFLSVFPVYIMEIMLIMILVTMKIKFMMYLIILFSAFIEELVRNIPMYTYLESKRKDRKIKVKLTKIIKNSILLGFGFFAAEKILLIMSIIPFTYGLKLVQFGGLIIPLLSHMIFSFVFGLSYKISKSYGWSLLLSTLLHFLANITIILYFIKP